MMYPYSILFIFFLFFPFLIVTPLPKDLGYDNLFWKILTKSNPL